jgi:hypothetical protein
MLGADSSASSSVALTSSTLDKIRVLADPFPMGRANHRNRRGESSSKSGDGDEEALAESWTQQTIAAAAAGESADCDRLLDILAAHCTIREYENGVGCDVETVYDGSAVGGGRGIIGASAPSGLDAESVAHFARAMIADSLRSGGRFSLCLLVAGMVKTDVSSLVNGETSDRDASHSGRLRRQVEAATSKVTASTRVESAASRSKECVATSRRQHLVPRMFWLDEYGSIQQLQYGAHGYASNFALSILDRGYRSDLSREEATDLIKNCFKQLQTRYIINVPNPPLIKCIDADGCRVVDAHVASFRKTEMETQ